MKQIKFIALNTVKETLRDKIYYSVFIFAIFIILLTYFLGQLTYRDEAKITMDLGLAAINISGILIAIFLGVSLVFKEIDKRSIYPIISKPVSRYKFIAGKYLGLAVVISGNVIIMGFMVSLNVVITGGKVPLIFFQALFLMLCEMLVMIAVAMFFSTFTTVVLSSMFSIGIYLISHSTSAIDTIEAKSKGIKLLLVQILNFVSPNFEILNLKHLVPYVQSVNLKVLLFAAGYALIYFMAFYAGILLIFSRKDFK